MPLLSPRFRNEENLKPVEAGRGFLKRGVRGHHVHIVQMALLDLGFKMPHSTTDPGYSPDGIYGGETEQAVKAFQRVTPGLVPDGTIGQNTIRALDRRHGRFTHRVTLHFRELTPTTVDMDDLISSTQAIYAQYGIEIALGSGMCLRLSEEQQRRYGTINQHCDWEVDDGQIDDLQKLGPRIPSDQIGVFIVDRFYDYAGGCGGHALGRPACTVAHDSEGWVVAHEIGHVLLTSTFTPLHSTNSANLMNPDDVEGASDIRTLTPKQLAAMRANPLCHQL